MANLPKMSAREIVATTVMLTLFAGVLAAMYLHGMISLIGIALIVAMGVVFVGGTIYLYALMWDEDD